MEAAAQIVRHPNGQWVAVAAVPIGTQMFRFNQILDERPIRDEANRRLGFVVGPRTKFEEMRPGVATTTLAGLPTPNAVESVINLARRASDALVNKAVREKLLHDLGQKIKAVADVMEQAYRKSRVPLSEIGFGPIVATSTAVSGITENDKLHVAIGQTMSAIAAGQPDTLRNVLEMAKRIPADAKSTKYVQELVMHSVGTTAARILFMLFHQNGLEKLAMIVAKANAPASPKQAA